MITEYDPNIRWARHSFELTFMQWDYSRVIEVDVLGNCKGATLFDSAIHTAFEECYDDDEGDALIVLSRPAEDGNGVDTLEVSLEDEDDLGKICVGVRIVGHVKEEK